MGGGFAQRRHGAIGARDWTGGIFMEMRWRPLTDYYAEQLKNLDEGLVASIATR